MTASRDTLAETAAVEILEIEGIDESVLDAARRIFPVVVFEEDE